MIRRAEPVATVLGAIHANGLKVRQRGQDQWQFQCPAHDDHDPSASLSVGGDGRALIVCHAGCDTADIIASLELSWSDTFAGNTTRRRVAPIRRSHEYAAPKWPHAKAHRLAPTENKSRGRATVASLAKYCGVPPEELAICGLRNEGGVVAPCLDREGEHISERSPIRYRIEQPWKWNGIVGAPCAPVWGLQRADLLLQGCPRLWIAGGITDALTLIHGLGEGAIGILGESRRNVITAEMLDGVVDVRIIAEFDCTGWKFAHEAGYEITQLVPGTRVSIVDIGSVEGAPQGADVRWLWRQCQGDREVFRKEMGL